MPTEIKMPKLSDNMEEGTVIRWLVSAGDSIAEGDPIAEVETDKADVEIEAESGGVVGEIVVEAGSSAAVGAVIARLDGDAAAADAAPEKKQAPRQEPPKQQPPKEEPPKREPARKEPPQEQPRQKEPPKPKSEPQAKSRESRESRESDDQADPAASSAGAARVSPVARELAAEHGVDVQALRGSGPGGRIVKRDVEQAIAGRSDTQGEPAAADAGVAADSAASDGDAQTMSRMRRTIAARMEQSKREIPHFYVRTQVEVGDLMDLYESLREDDVIPGLTVTHLLIRAMALTLPRHPRLNAHWVDDSVRLNPDVNIGIVVAVDDGLLVPVVKQADQLSLAALVEQARALVERTRRSKFKPDDLIGGTISVSNIGMLDVDELTPIINLPQAAIIGVGAVREQAMVREGEIYVGRAMRLTLACDHRILHGLEAGRFLQDLKHALERPAALLVERE